MCLQYIDWVFSGYKAGHRDRSWRFAELALKVLIYAALKSLTLPEAFFYTCTTLVTKLSPMAPGSVLWPGIVVAAMSGVTFCFSASVLLWLNKQEYMELPESVRSIESLLLSCKKIV